MRQQQADVLHSSRTLLVHSKKLSLLVNSERQMIHNRKVINDLRTINMLKNQLLKHSIKNNKWKFCGVQLSMQFEGLNSSMLNEIFEVRRRLLLADIYKLVFVYQIPYGLVHQALDELTSELNMQNQMSEYLHDPITMVISTLLERSKNYPSEKVDPEFLGSIVKNQSSFIGIDDLTNEKI